MWSALRFFKQAAVAVNDTLTLSKPIEFIFGKLENGAPTQGYQFIFDMDKTLGEIPDFCYESVLEQCGLQLMQNTTCTPVGDSLFYHSCDEKMTGAVPAGPLAIPDSTASYKENLFECKEFKLNQTTVDCLTNSIYCCGSTSQNPEIGDKIVAIMFLIGGCIGWVGLIGCVLSGMGGGCHYIVTSCFNRNNGYSEIPTTVNTNRNDETSEDEHYQDRTLRIRPT